METYNLAPLLNADAFLCKSNSKSLRNCMINFGLNHHSTQSRKSLSIGMRLMTCVKQQLNQDAEAPPHWSITSVVPWDKLMSAEASVVMEKARMNYRTRLFPSFYPMDFNSLIIYI